MLEVKNVSKTHTSKKRIGLFKHEKLSKEAVKDVSLQIPRGKIIGVLGENGAGKTTLIKMMTTLLIPDSGTIIMDGVNINHNLKQTRYRINIISGGEKNLYWRLTAVENLLYFASLYGLSKQEALPKIDNLLKEIGLWESKDIPVEQYSKGMKQRLQIVKGLINDPEYLFLDELTLGLDVSVAIELRDMIRQIAREKNTGILLTTHYMAEAEELCDYLYILQKGQLVLSGTQKEVFEKLDMVNELQVILADGDGVTNEQEKALKEEFDVSAFEKENHQLTFKIRLAQISLQDIMDFLYQNKLEIKEIKLLEPTLEEVLIKSKG